MNKNKLKKDDLIFVRYTTDREWKLRYFSHFEDGEVFTFVDQYTSNQTKKTIPWDEWSIDNPLKK